MFNVEFCFIFFILDFIYNSKGSIKNFSMVVLPYFLKKGGVSRNKIKGGE